MTVVAYLLEHRLPKPRVSGWDVLQAHHRQIPPHKFIEFPLFLAGIGKLYSSPALGEVPQAEGYIFQHLFNLRPWLPKPKVAGKIIRRKFSAKEAVIGDRFNIIELTYSKDIINQL